MNTGINLKILFVGAATMLFLGIIFKNDPYVAGGLVLMWIGLANQ